MTSDSPVSSWLQPFTEFRCPDCGSNAGFRSRRRTFSERFLLPIFLLQPVRCAECFRREYRLIFTRVRERLSEASGMVAASSAAPPTRRNVA
ncbi:MAG: hypothetical protein WCA16_17325 [Candidatus Sulfotelmatobacter sp.]